MMESFHAGLLEAAVAGLSEHAWVLNLCAGDELVKFLHVGAIRGR